MLEAYLITLTGVALAQASPGPNFIAVAAAAMGQGRKAALFTVLGVSTGMLIWAAAVAFGLAAVLALYPALLTALKILGGGYLLYLALKAVKAAFTGGETSVQASKREMTPFQCFRRGLLVIVTNPKAALMWTAVAAFLFGSGLNAVQVLGFGPVAFLSAFLIYGGYGLMFSTGVATRAYARFTRVIEGLLGVAFGAIGGRLLADGIHDLRD